MSNLFPDLYLDALNTMNIQQSQRDCEVWAHMQEKIEQIECPHPELISGPTQDGMLYICTRCAKHIVISHYAYVNNSVKGLSEAIGAVFGPAWEQKAKEQNGIKE